MNSPMTAISRSKPRPRITSRRSAAGSATTGLAVATGEVLQEMRTPRYWQAAPRHDGIHLAAAHDNPLPYAASGQEVPVQRAGGRRRERCRWDDLRRADSTPTSGVHVWCWFNDGRRPTEGLGAHDRPTTLSPPLLQARSLHSCWPIGFKTSRMTTTSGEPEDLDDVRAGVSGLRATSEDVDSVADRHHAKTVTWRR